jgi:peroxiredoxin
MALLQDKLDAITERTRHLVQAERLAISERASEDLFASGIEQNILPVGAEAPEFTLEDAVTGKPVRLSDLLAIGPVVLKVFRGRWCPYCVTELEHWRELAPELRRHGALLVAISPQSRRQNDFMAQQHGLRFPLLADPGAKVAAEYGVSYTLPPEQREYYRSILINLPFNHSGRSYGTALDDDWQMTVAALFLLRPHRDRDGNVSGTVAFAQAFADFRVRPEPDDLLAALG